MKNILVGFLSVSLLFSGVLGFSGRDVLASEGSQDNEILDEVVNIIEEQVIIDSEGVSLNSEEEIIDHLDTLDIEAIEQLMIEQHVPLDGELTSEKLLELYSVGIEKTNEEINNGTLVVLDNGTLEESDDENFYLQGGVTKDIKYWWGVKRYKSTSNARTWEYNIRSAAHANAAGSLVGGIVFGGVGAVPNGITSIYLYNLADRISYHNGRTSKGIIANMHYTLTFSISTQ